MSRQLCIENCKFELYDTPAEWEQNHSQVCCNAFVLLTAIEICFTRIKPIATITILLLLFEEQR